MLSIVSLKLNFSLWSIFLRCNRFKNRVCTHCPKNTLNLGIKTEPVTVGPLISGPSILIKTKAGHTIQYTLLLHPLQIRLIFWDTDTWILDTWYTDLRRWSLRCSGRAS